MEEIEFLLIFFSIVYNETFPCFSNTVLTKNTEIKTSKMRIEQESNYGTDCLTFSFKSFWAKFIIDFLRVQQTKSSLKLFFKACKVHNVLHEVTMKNDN